MVFRLCESTDYFYFKSSFVEKENKICSTHPHVKALRIKLTIFLNCLKFLEKKVILHDHIIQLLFLHINTK